MNRGLTVLLLVSACLRPPPPPPPPLPPNVPEGCLELLGGRWVLLGDPSFIYDAVDDGGALELTARHARQPVDAGFRPRRFRLDAGLEPADAGSPARAEETLAVIFLDRTPSGFLGATRARVTTAQGQRCEVSFHTEVLECSDGGLLLNTEPFADLDESCQVLRPAAPTAFVEHRLSRAP